MLKSIDEIHDIRAYLHAIDPQAVVYSATYFDEALLGVEDKRAVYDYDKLVEILQRVEGASYESAVEQTDGEMAAKAYGMPIILKREEPDAQG